MADSSTISEKVIWKCLEEIPDPEIPVLNIVELGIVRGTDVSGDEVAVTITPTYNGCPAMFVIESDIVAKLKEKGISKFRINTVLSPPWTTEWMSEAAKEKLRIYGISPPRKNNEAVKCPRCQSSNVSIKSEFGSTPCKSLYFCNDCIEPFEHFKCH